jgi:hypothetical protein
MFRKPFVVGMCLALLFAACESVSNSFVSTTATPEVGLVVPRLPLAISTNTLPSLAAQATEVQSALAQTPPIIPLPDLDPNQDQAQTIALGDPRVAGIAHTTTGEPARTQIFGIYPARQSDITDATVRCSVAHCYRVELYNFALNLALVALVDIDNRQVVAVANLSNAQPDIPASLRQVALDIATHAPEVIQALGFQPSADLALMSSTKTSLNLTRCQRSHHLCVAPTFVSGERALWAIVDLTDNVLVGVRWTTVGAVPGAVTERSLQNDVVSALYCDHTTPLEKNGWKLDYILTSSDGLRISTVRFKDQPVLDSAKLVDWHVSYSNQDGFGYSDAVGCPVFSQAAVVAFEGPTLEDIRDGNGQVIGFALRQKFWSDLWPLPCNYYYEQRYEFYNDGRFRVEGGNVGRGCNTVGTYRPVLRIAFAGPQTISNWNGTQWVDWAAEQWQAQANDAYTPERYEYRVQSQGGSGYYVEPGQGQFGDGGRGDDALIYATRHHADRDEGDSDLITIGPCCNGDYQQGPERFIDATPEDIAGKEVVLWYVAQMKLDGKDGEQYCWADSTLTNGVYVAKTYPCYAGPMFVPFSP